MVCLVMITYHGSYRNEKAGQPLLQYVEKELAKICCPVLPTWSARTPSRVD
ncbi:MAG: hypothetical protein WB564_03015 [Dehalococcoidia bacterium]